MWASQTDYVKQKSGDPGQTAKQNLCHGEVHRLSDKISARLTDCQWRNQMQ